MALYFSANDMNTGIGEWRAYQSDGTSGGFLTPHQKSSPDNTANTVIKINYNGFNPINTVTGAQAPVYTSDYGLNYDNGVDNAYGPTSVYSDCGSVSLTNSGFTIITRVTFQSVGNSETVFNFIQDSGIRFGLRRYGVSSQIEAFIYNSSGMQVLSAIGGNIVQGQSTCLAIKWSELGLAFLNLYQDGIDITTAQPTETTSLVGTYTSTYLARSNDTMFTGYIYEFRCQTCALSIYEIQSTMRTFNGLYSFQVSTEGSVGIGGAADSPEKSKLKIISDYSTKLAMYSNTTNAPVYMNFTEASGNSCFIGMAGYYNQVYEDTLFADNPGALALGTYQNHRPIIFGAGDGAGALSESMRIIDGKVGIGTTAPSATLHVTGNIHASNSVTTTNVFATRYYGDGGLLSNINSFVQPLDNLVVSNSVYANLVQFSNTINSYQASNPMAFEDGPLTTALSSDGSTLVRGYLNRGGAYVYDIGSAQADYLTYSVSYDAWSVSINADATVIAVGDPNNNLVLVYRKSGTTWSPVPYVINGIPDTFFGLSVSISDDGTKTLVCEGMVSGGWSTASPPSFTGSAYLYTFNTPNWVLTTTFPGIAGSSVALSGDGLTCVFGQTYYNNRRGRVSITKDLGVTYQYFYGDAVENGFGYHVSSNRDGTRIVANSTNDQNPELYIKIFTLT